MSSTSNNLELKKRVAQTLSAAGWESVDPLSFEHTAAVAIKEYVTAVGVKTAFVYLLKTGEGSCTLTADYQSDGRNALSTTTCRITRAMSEQDTAGAVSCFADEVDKVVSGTYAARLAR